MTSRRRMLQVAGAGVASLSLGAWTRVAEAPAIGAAPSAGPVTGPHMVLFDARFVWGRRFGRDARALGMPTAPTNGDVTSLWYDDLYHRWKKKPVGLAGLTTPETWFALNGLGADFGLKPVLEVEHRVADGVVGHRFPGSRAAFERAALNQPGPGWTARMARAVAASPPTPLDRRAVPAVSQAPTNDGDGRATLVSWVLAPIGKPFHSDVGLELA